MNARQRMQAAIAGLPTDIIPVAPSYLDLYLDELIRRNYRQAYERKLSGRASCPVDHAEDVRFRANAIIEAYKVFAEQPDWMHVAYCESRAWAEQGEIFCDAGQFYYQNKVTGERQDLRGPETFLLPRSIAVIDTNSAAADNWDGAQDIQDEAAVDALIPIRSAEDMEAEGIFDLATLLAQELGAHTYLRCETGSPFWFAYTVLGFSGMMVMLQERPELFCYVMLRKHEQRAEVCRAYARAGVHAVWVEEALSSADLISVRSYERYAFPTTQAYLKRLSGMGLTTILYYCGDVIPRLPSLKHLGMAALAVEESKKDFKIDIGAVVAGIGGACTVFGNMDSVNVVHEGSSEALQAEVRRQIGAGRQARGFVMCQGSPFPLDTAPARIDEFARATRLSPAVS